jgi:hypothetical protein
MEDTQLAVIQEKAANMERVVNAIKITTDGEYDAVADNIANVKKLQKYIEGEKARLVDPAKAIIEEAKAKYDPFITKCKEARAKLDTLALDYYNAKEKKRLEDEAKIAARVGEGKGHLKEETAAAQIEALPEVQKSVRTDSGQMIITKRPVMHIIDPSKVPDEFWIIDEVRLRQAAIALHKASQPMIAGVEVVLEAGTSARL